MKKKLTVALLASAAACSILFGRTEADNSATQGDADARVRSEAPAPASTTLKTHPCIPPIPLSKLAVAADEIVYGRVIERRTSGSAGSALATVYTVQVLSAVKGLTLPTVSVAVGGGEVGDFKHVVEGAPQFAEGEEAVLFLQHVPELECHVILGLARGAYRASRDVRGRTVVTGDEASRVDVGDFLGRVAEAWTDVSHR